MSTVLDHINLVVSDLDRSVRFYKEYLGFKKIKNIVLNYPWMDDLVGLKNVKSHVVFLELKHIRLELIQYLSPQETSFQEHSIPNTLGLRHIAFQVSDIDDRIVFLKKKNVIFPGKLVTVDLECLGMGKGLKKIIYFFDPDRILLEMNEYIYE